MFQIIAILVAVAMNNAISDCAAVTATNYCLDSLCDGLQHIACNNTGAFGGQCPANAKAVPLTNALKTLTLEAHNKFRNQVAIGGVKNYDKAARMATLVWNDELAKLAEYNARRCYFEHDECRNTDKFMYAGQNLGQVKNSAKYQTVEAVISAVIQGWFDENKYADMNYMGKYQNHKSGKMIGHFAQLIRDESYAVGCGLVQFYKDGWYMTIFSCDYTLSNIMGNPIYEKSTKAASKCQTGVNTAYPGLCSAREIYDNDLFYN